MKRLALTKSRALAVGGAAVAALLLALTGCSSDSDSDGASGSTEATGGAGTASTAAGSQRAPADDSGCGVTLAEVQALLPPTSGVTENSTPDPGRCNFTWDDGRPRGIDVARVPGGRAAFEAQSDKVPAGADHLKDGSRYQTVSGYGDQAWAFGDAHAVNIVVLDGSDLIVVDAVTQGGPPDPTNATGLSTELLDLCNKLVAQAAG